ncbi:haloacid dehalogenase type II [Sneathiella chinensis]|uniref:(S)-2-haloacid dehalogenase n=1 Tax=Sneathiella chinensis TaxID=349750 RepID=A0ABQ5U7J3_9PROT|nr:haloacid dehalogenase type II [Sneathiella chinensis]GLQ07386.1 haloacid dehalogenase [Sneathiella chinensis]
MTDQPLSGIKACVFDAYGTLFDVNAAARQEQDRLGEAWEQIADLWRMKQLQYTWLRSLQDNYADFWQVTGEALDFALASVGMTDPRLKSRLMDLYLTLSAYPEVADTLTKLNNAGMRCAILSNGSPDMLNAAVRNAGLTDLLDGIYSVQDVKVFKPHPKVYQLAVDRLHVDARQICFQSSNGWDAYSARDFGFRVIWCNRFNQAAERIPAPPDHQVTNLRDILPLLGV